MPHISIRQALQFAFSYSYSNAAEIGARIALPAVLGWIAFYLSLFLYMKELERYLNNPNDRIASLVLGLATAGLLVTLFLHAVIVASVTALALGSETRGWKFFSVARREWRLYAADLRLLLVAGIWIGVMQFLQFAAGWAWLPSGFSLVLDVIMSCGLAFLAVRVWSLVAPVSVGSTHGDILRRAWRISAGNFWRLAAIVAALLLVGLVVEAVCEIAMRAAGLIPPFPSSASLADYTAVYRVALPGVMVVVGIAYLVSNILLTVARVSVYRQLTEQTAR